jgi:hypothetical protein
MDPHRMHNSIVCLLMYSLMMVPRAETCSDIVRPINSVMHSEMWGSWLVYCYVWQEKQNSYIVITYNRMHSLRIKNLLPSNECCFVVRFEVATQQQLYTLQYCHVLEWLSTGFWVCIGFTDHVYTRLRTTSNYSVTANLHNSKITTAPAKPFPACCVFTSRSLTTALTVETLQLPRPSLLWMAAPFQLRYNCPFSSEPRVQNWIRFPNYFPYDPSAGSGQRTPFILVGGNVLA